LTTARNIEGHEELRSTGRPAVQADRVVGETAPTSRQSISRGLWGAASPDRAPPSAARSNIPFVTLVSLWLKRDC